MGVTMKDSEAFERISQGSEEEQGMGSKELGVIRVNICCDWSHGVVCAEGESLNANL
jgi:hypothetical protein